MKQSIKLIIAWLNGILWCYALGWVFNWLYYKVKNETGGWMNSQVRYGLREEAVFPTLIILCGYIVFWIVCIRKRLEREELRDTLVKRILFCYIYVICPLAGWVYLSAGALL